MKSPYWRAAIAYWQLTGNAYYSASAAEDGGADYPIPL
jgi:hypothetical protein